MTDNTEDEKTCKALEDAQQAQLPYKWTQTIRDVSVTAPIPGTLKGKDMHVDLRKDSIRVGIKGQEPIIEGPLPHPIDTTESSWTLETTPHPPGKEISLHLDKINKVNWWAHVVTSAPAIDVTKITPESSKLSDLDGPTRAMVEKMMVEQREKEAAEAGAAAGVGVGGNSEEVKKREILRRFQEQHPEMDFSKAQIG